MPATRWNTSILEMLNWLYEQQAGFEELIALPITPRIIQSEGEAEGEKERESRIEEQIPAVLPVLPSLPGFGERMTSASLASHTLDCHKQPSLT